MYGLVIGDLYFGESMFSKMENASKVAIHYLSQTIQPFLIDTQVHSPHLGSLGAETIERDIFIETILAREHLSLNI
jgi:leucyl/phenylalanyl-tRNA--protein transferase